jgi:hypothetical protein
MLGQQHIDDILTRVWQQMVVTSLEQRRLRPVCATHFVQSG